MWRLPAVFEDERALAAAFRTAEPFAHVVIDDFVPAGDLPELLGQVDEEPLATYAAEIYAFEASAPEPRSKELLALRAAFVDVLAGPLSRITGREVSRADMRVYAYGPGHYLLPHTDHQEDVGRVLAYAYYLPSPSLPLGGELELYACELEGDVMTRADPVKAIAPVANRLVVFEVSDRSLHQVREVLEGVRLSLSGWFYP